MKTVSIKLILITIIFGCTSHHQANINLQENSSTFPTISEGYLHIYDQKISIPTKTKILHGEEFPLLFLNSNNTVSLVIFDFPDRVLRNGTVL